MGMSERVPGCCEEARAAVEWSTEGGRWEWVAVAAVGEWRVPVDVNVPVTRCPYCGAALTDGKEER